MIYLIKLMSFLVLHFKKKKSFKDRMEIFLKLKFKIKMMMTNSKQIMKNMILQYIRKKVLRIF